MNLLVRKNAWVFVSHQTVQSSLLNLLVLMAQELKRRNGGVMCLRVYSKKYFFFALGGVGVGVGEGGLLHLCVQCQ